MLTLKDVPRICQGIKFKYMMSLQQTFTTDQASTYGLQFDMGSDFEHYLVKGSSTDMAVTFYLAVDQAVDGITNDIRISFSKTMVSAYPFTVNFGYAFVFPGCEPYCLNNKKQLHSAVYNVDKKCYFSSEKDCGDCLSAPQSKFDYL